MLNTRFAGRTTASPLLPHAISTPANTTLSIVISSIFITMWNLLAFEVSRRCHWSRSVDEVVMMQMPSRRTKMYPTNLFCFRNVTYLGISSLCTITRHQPPFLGISSLCTITRHQPPFSASLPYALFHRDPNLVHRLPDALRWSKLRIGPLLGPHGNPSSISWERTIEFHCHR